MWKPVVIVGFWAISSLSVAEDIEQYNGLADDYNALVKSQAELQAQYNELVLKYNAIAVKEKQYIQQIRELKMQHKGLIRNLKLPGCAAAKTTLKQCVPEIF